MTIEATVEIGSLLVSKPGYRQGRPCLRGTGLTVHNVAAWHMMGRSIDEIIEDNSDLDPSLFYAAFAYYFANQRKIEAELDEDDRYGEELRKRYPNGITPETFDPNDPL